MKKAIIIVLVLGIIFGVTGCGTKPEEEVNILPIQEVEQDMIELEEDIEEIEVDRVGEEIETIEEESEPTLEDFKGEYLDEIENIVINIEEETFILGYYMSEGIIIYHPIYTIEGEYLRVEGLALDGFDGTEYETSYTIEKPSQDNIIFLGDNFTYNLVRIEDNI